MRLTGRAAGFAAQVDAIGQMPTALVAVTNAVADGHVDVMPEVLVTGGGSSLDGLAAALMRTFTGNGTGNGGPTTVAIADGTTVAEHTAPDQG